MPRQRVTVVPGGNDLPALTAMVGTDQAAGLRSLLKRRSLRLLAVLGDCETRALGACTGQLAFGLARAGHSVLLLDAAGSAMDALALRADGDLADLIADGGDFARVAVRGAAGLRAISARRGLPELIAAEAAGADFFAGFMRAAEPPDLLILCLPPMAAPNGRLWLPLDGAAGESLLVTTPGERALTAAYASIKQACLPATRTAPAFRILVNGADGERDARAICRQLSDTARRFLGGAVGYAGNVPRNARGQIFGSGVAPPHAEAARAFARIAAEVPGWRLAECMHNPSTATQTH